MGIVINPTCMDMRTMVFPYASANRMTITAAMVQMLHEFYGCPTGVHSGKTDACAPNAQAGFEKALSSFVPVAFGAIGIGTLGNMEAGGLTYSPVQLTIDNEIVGYIRKILGGIEVSETSLAVDVINEVGPGGNFLDHPHTAEHLRTEYFDSEITERLPWEAWEAQDLKGIEAKAAEKVKRILATHQPRALAPEQEREIDRVVASYLGT
jgi:trimethylamine--corrinoid protein Co-methyltransferase